jgi:predicted Zn-dependent protease
MRLFSTVTILAAMRAAAAPARGQSLGSLMKGAGEVKKTVDDLHISEADEVKIGTDVSAMLREKYGVVQDAAVHKYVTLAGTLLAQQSSRPKLNWQFIVLDTDGINAFAAPGGFIHITRGALSIVKNEAELADILGHEISHVTEKHAIKAIEESNAIGKGAELTHVDAVKKLTDAVYKMVIEGAYSRKDEMEADKHGIALASAAGYAPGGLGDFLTRLDARNKNQPDRNGMFASHPDTDARLDGLKKEIKSQKLNGTALVAARYAQHISYTPIPMPAGTEAPTSGGGKLGLGGMAALGKDKSSNQSVSSGGSRGLNTERDAKGGPNKGAVIVSVTAAEISEFRKGIAG